MKLSLLLVLGVAAHSIIPTGPGSEQALAKIKAEQLILNDQNLKERDIKDILGDDFEQDAVPQNVFSKTPYNYFVDFLRLLDYFGLIRAWFNKINSIYWPITTWRFLGYMPVWFWMLIYLYIVIAPQTMFVYLIIRMSYDTFIGEPRQKKIDLKN